MTNFKNSFKRAWAEITKINEMSLQDAALYYARLGWPVLPVAPNAKNPYTKHGVHDATCNAQQIQKWFAPTSPDQPVCNLGIRCGLVAQLLVVDTDVKGASNGLDAFCTLCAENEFDPYGTLHAQSPSGGVHFYFSLPQGFDLKNRVNLKEIGLPCVDIRTEGGYIVAPPSQIAGKSYRWLNTHKLSEIALLQLPEFLLKILSKPTQLSKPTNVANPELETKTIKDVLQLITNKTLREMPNIFAQIVRQVLQQTCKTIETTSEGSRNTTLNTETLKTYRLLWTLQTNKINLDQQFIDAIPERLVQAAHKAGLAETEITATLASARTSAQKLGAYPLPRKIGEQPSVKEISEAKLAKVIAQDPEKRERVDYDPAFCSTDSFLQHVEQALMQRDAKIYRKDDRLVILLPNETDIENINLLEHDHLQYLIGKSFIFVVEGKFGFRTVEVPDKLVDRILKGRQGYWSFNRLKTVFNAPTLNIETGELLDTPGYDPKTKYYFSFDSKQFHRYFLENLQRFPNKNPEELLAIARSNLETIKTEALGEFGFDGEVSRNTTLAAILTGVIRKQLPSAPMFCFDSPTPGSGKSTLCQCIGLLTTGQIPGLVQYTQKEEELEKRIVSLLLTEPALICFDNVKGSFDSASLSQILTTGTFDGRLLGENKMIKLRTNALMLLNGNNLNYTKDIVRRVLVCRLDRQMARPEIYAYKIKNPFEHWREYWSAFYVNALTVLKAFYNAGMPGSECVEGRSYPQWAKIVLGALQWCELGAQAGQVEWKNCPWLGQDVAFEIDPDQEALAAVLQTWQDTYQDKSVQTKNLADEDNAVFKALKSNFGLKNADAKTVSRCLRKYKDKVCTINGQACKLCYQTNSHKENNWQLQRLDRQADQFAD